MPISIERVHPRGGVPEYPSLTPRGYQLADPAFGKEKHYIRNATFVRTLREAADLIGKGFSIRMERKGKRASLISPKSLHVRR
ncbi:MAG: hypothetical protein C0454_07575 [Parvibaculum sp.]|jgi:hypothetical protein|nr:hypothetical protein [Parvibaculum sp.]